MSIAHTVDLPERCLIPTSELGRMYGAARIVARWRNMVAARFENGAIGHYTISRHIFLPVTA